MIYQFGEYELDLELYQLRCHGGLCKLEPKAFNVLCYLIKHRDRIVPKEELLDELWDSPYISDAALNSCIMAARRAVGDSGNIQQVIKTQRGRGYRFIASIIEHPTAMDERRAETGAEDDAANGLCPGCNGQVPVLALFCPYCGRSLSGDRSASATLSGLEVPLIGRESEYLRLQAFLQQVQAGKGQVVDIVGDPGIGKSFLIDHVRQQLPRDEVTFVHVFCPPVRVGAPGKPIRDTLRRCCGLAPSDLGPVVRERLTWWLSQLGIEPDEVLPYLFHLLGCAPESHQPVSQQPALLKIQMLMALRHIFVAYSQRQPLVIAVEDIQWLDQTSADCLAALTQNISELPVLLLLTRRPGEPPAWYERSEITPLALQPLSGADRAHLLQTILVSRPVSPEFEHAVLTRAKGHPGFLTQLAQWSADTRVCDEPNRLPASLTDAVMARLACASEAMRHLLQTASVLGHQTSMEVLEQVWEGNQALDDVLQDAVGGGFYYAPHDLSYKTYRFSQATLQSCIYQRMPEGQRQRLHLGVAKALETVFAGRLHQVSGLLAWHYVCAGQPERSLSHWREVAHEAARWGDYGDAIDLLGRMLAAIDGLPEQQQRRLRLECMLDQARWLMALGRSQESVELLQTEHEAFIDMQEPRLLGQYALVLSRGHSQEGAWDQAVASAQQAIEDAMAGRDGGTAGQAYTILAMERYRIGRADEGAAYSRQAIGLLEQPENETKRAFANFILGLNCVVLGHFGEAIEATRQARETGDSFVDPHLQASSAWAMGWALASQGKREAGVAACQQALAMAPDPLTMAFALGTMGYVYLEQDMLQEALPYLEQAVRAMQQCGYARMQGLYNTYLGVAHLRQGEIDRAQALAEEALEIAQATSDRFGAGWSLRLLGRVAQERGALDVSREHLNHAVRTFLSIRASFEVARTQLQLAEIACEQDEPRAATVYAWEAYHRFTALKVTVYMRHTETWAASRGLELTDVR